MRAELNSFYGKQISIKDCYHITLRLWKMSNSNFKLCTEAVNSLKSTNKKIVSFKKHFLNFLSKLLEKSGNGDFKYQLRTSNKTLFNNKTAIKLKPLSNIITPRLIFWISMLKRSLRKFKCLGKK